jgi:hypothetical protein
LVSKVFYDTDFKPIKYEGIAPIIETEMLVNLYGRELRPFWDDFVEKKNYLGEIYTDVILEKFKSDPTSKAKGTVNEIRNRHEPINASIEALLAKIADIIKP